MKNETLEDRLRDRATLYRNAVTHGLLLEAAAEVERLREAVRAIVALPTDYSSPEVFARAVNDIAIAALSTTFTDTGADQ